MSHNLKEEFAKANAKLNKSMARTIFFLKLGLWGSAILYVVLSWTYTGGPSGSIFLHVFSIAGSALLVAILFQIHILAFIAALIFFPDHMTHVLEILIYGLPAAIPAIFIAGISAYRYNILQQRQSDLRSKDRCEKQG